MLKKYMKLKSIILPNKKINYFVLVLIVIGFISGCIFLNVISKNDKELVISSIKTFFNSLSNKNSIDTLKNVGIINFVYIILLWLLSFSLVGIILNIFVIYFKSFILGFTISSIIYTYKFKAIIACIFYILPSQLLNLFVIYILGIYSIIFSLSLVGQIFKKNINLKITFRKYFYILLISSIITIISSITEAFLFPILLQLVSKLYV